MNPHFESIKNIYSDGERFTEMRVYADRKLKIWEEETSKLLPRNARLLDIGCGKGREAFCLNEKGFRVTGIDISETVINTAKQIAEINHLDIDFLVTDGENLPFCDSSFDVVVIWAQTYGLFYGDRNQQHILNECKRVLKDGGILSFSGHNKEFLQEAYPQFLKAGYFYPFASDLHYTIFTVGEMADCASKAGFTAIDCKQGIVYTKEDGTIIHCTCRKEA